MERDFERRIDALEDVFSFVREFYDREGIRSETFDVDLVLEELFTNMVRHNHDGERPITVELARTGARLQLRLVDPDSIHFDPTLAPEVDTGASGEERPIGGLGIHLVRRLSEDFTYDFEDPRSTITVVMRLED